MRPEGGEAPRYQRRERAVNVARGPGILGPRSVVGARRLRYGKVMTCTRAALALLAGLSALALAPTAHAEPLPYRGPHPVGFDGSWHLEREVHVHDRLPVGTEPFARVEGVHVFLGDPVAHGYEGTVWTYEGVHPLPWGMPGYCGLSGEHDHPFAPEGQYRRDRGGVYDYVGPLRGGLGTYRPRRVGVPRAVRREREERAEEAAARGYRWGVAPVLPSHAHRRAHGRHRGPREAPRRRWRIRTPQCTALTNPRAVVFDGCPPVVRTDRGSSGSSPRQERSPRR